MTSPIVGLNLCSATHDSEMNTISSAALVQIKTGKTQVKQGTRAGRTKVTHESNSLHYPHSMPGSVWIPGGSTFSEKQSSLISWNYDKRFLKSLDQKWNLFKNTFGIVISTSKYFWRHNKLLRSSIRCNPHPSYTSSELQSYQG